MGLIGCVRRQAQAQKRGVSCQGWCCRLWPRRGLSGELEVNPKSLTQHQNSLLHPLQFLPSSWNSTRCLNGYRLNWLLGLLLDQTASSWNFVWSPHWCSSHWQCVTPSLAELSGGPGCTSSLKSAPQKNILNCKRCVLLDHKLRRYIDALKQHKFRSRSRFDLG